MDKYLRLPKAKSYGFTLGNLRYILYRFDSGYKRNEGFHFLWFVIELATDLGMSQEAAVTEGLKRARTDAQLLAYLMTCEPFF